MSRFRLANKLRQADYWKPLMALLDANDIKDWDVEDGGSHAALVLTFHGQHVRFTLPCTPGSASHSYVVVNLRRRLRAIGEVHR